MKGGYKAANGNYKWLKASECIEYEKRAVVVNEACIKEERSPLALKEKAAPWHFHMQVTPGEQTRDTITAVGRKTRYKKKNTLLIRKDNTVSFRGNSQREAQQPAISSPGCCCGSPETASMQERQLHRIDATPNNSSICRLPAFALIFPPFSYITGEEMDSLQLWQECLLFVPEGFAN